MRLAVVSATTDHHRETERTWRTHRLVDQFAERGHEVAVFCAQWWEGSPERFEHEGIEYRACSRAPGEAGFATRVPGALRRFDPDVVHAVHDAPSHVLTARVGAVLARAPLVVDWYDVDPPEPATGTLGAVRRGLTNWLRRRATRTPTTLLTPSRMVKTRVRELGAASEDVEVVPNGVEFDRIREVDPADGGEIVYSRSLDEDANMESLLLALAELREVGWRATVVGDGPAREEYERQARDLRIDDRVEFVGERSVEERLALFRNAHVYVHTARRTPFPTDLCRALACGCVGVVEYHVDSAAHELVEQRQRGFLATSDSELVEAVAASADFPHMDVDDDFAAYGEEAVLQRYLDCYREARDAVGAFD